METKNLKQYTGTKTVKAMPMTLGEAERVLNRHIDTSAVENRDKVPGYLVEYGEDGDNYRSWSPKEVFERVYHPSETHIDRMRIELDELIERYMRGRRYSFTSKDFDCLLREQLEIMERYIYKLKDRIHYAEYERNANSGIEPTAVITDCKASPEPVL